MTIETAPSVCPHDCPSACALEVERLDAKTIGKVKGPKNHPYSHGCICAKVARYADRVHHPDRLTMPLKRVGPKGECAFEPIGWDEALDKVAESFRQATKEHGPESVWPYNYSGTMGHLQRDGMERLRNVMGYSQEKKTICTAVARPGWKAGCGVLRGVDSREMAQSDLIVIWGMNAVHTQVHVVELVRRARKERGAKIVVIDPYRNPTAALSDTHLMLRPGTDGALACAVMHVLFKEGFADRDYLAQYTRDADRLEAHLESRGPEWAAGITGLSVDEIVDFARLYGQTQRSFIRLGYGLTRSRNGAVNMHAVSCLPAVTGAWRHEGGGALYSAGGVFHLDKTLIEGADHRDPNTRILDMSMIGRVLMGDEEALGGTTPVKAMLIQNTNPMDVAPEHELVRRGFSREDLFVCVHEQFMTETAKMADIILPATTFLEHHDLYTAGGHTFLQVSKPVIEPLEGARSNHQVISGLAERLGADLPAFKMDEWAIIDATLKQSGYPSADEIHAMGGLECTPSFEDAHFLNGFGHADKKFHFAPDWPTLGDDADGMPELPDHFEVIEEASEEHGFRLVTAPSWHFLNSTFTETPMAQKIQKRPTALLHPADAETIGVGDGDLVRLGNERGSVAVHARLFDGLSEGLVVVEGIWPNNAFVEGKGINVLVGADPVQPAGGAAFHDTAVWVQPAS